MNICPLPPAWNKHLEKFCLSTEAIRHAVTMRYSKDERVSSRGGSVDYLRVLVVGRLKVSIPESNGRSLILSYYGPGEILGDVELMSGYPGAGDVTALSDAEFAAVPIRICAQELDSNASFACAIARELAKKLAKSSGVSAANTLFDLNTRLCAYITESESDGMFCEKLTDTAELLGVSYRHLLRTLSALCERGILERVRRGTYRIRNRSALEAEYRN